MYYLAYGRPPIVDRSVVKKNAKNQLALKKNSPWSIEHFFY